METETKQEFLARKKGEKKNQMRRQIEAAYDTVFAGTYTANGELLRWRIEMEPKMENVYSTCDVSKILGIPRERFRDWMVRGFITPSLPSTGKGTIAVFTDKDIVNIKRFLELINKGFKREAAAKIIKKQKITIDSAFPQPLFCIGQEVVILSNRTKKQGNPAVHVIVEIKLSCTSVIEEAGFHNKPEPFTYSIIPKVLMGRRCSPSNIRESFLAPA